VVIMDFDNFKVINNRYGHHVGDLALHHVASLIRREARSCDIPVRYGGDEFALLLPNGTEETGLIVAARIQEQIRQPVLLEGQPITIGLSIGIAACATNELSLREAVKQADKAAYFSKACGKGRITLYSQVQNLPHPLYENEEEAPKKRAFEPSVVPARRAITKGLLEALKARDKHTYQHSISVAMFAVRLAQEIGMSQEMVEEIKFGALLHDIGKLGISDEVLGKNTTLSSTERKNMRTHAVIGHDVLKHFGPVFESILPIVLSHHERMDGQGYPERIEATRLPQGVRIVTIADAFDSMTRDQEYRERMPIAWAIEELRRCAGTQFDPELVEAFVAMMQKRFPERLEKADGGRLAMWGLT
jgi:diguanylate cyclase (GGDEF)-like protein/putative nucleotidyltransferase with HDIG domain